MLNEKPSLVDSNFIKWIIVILAILGFFGWATVSGLWRDGTDESKSTFIQPEPKNQKEQSATDSTQGKIDSVDSSKRN